MEFEISGTKVFDPINTESDFDNLLGSASLKFVVGQAQLQAPSIDYISIVVTFLLEE